MLAVNRIIEHSKQAGTRVFVTGASGYVGGELVALLRKHGVTHCSVDLKGSKERDVLALDLRDKPATASAIEAFQPDVIVHCGTHSALAYRDRFLPSFNDDAAALTNILEGLARRPACRLIGFSSTYIYSGVESSEPVVETDALQPAHNFGVARSFFEQLTMRTHPSTVVFRLSSVFGPGNALHPNAVFNMARECLDSGKLTVWGSGTRKMQYVYMPDVLLYIAQAFGSPAGIFNLGGNEYSTVADSATEIARFFGAEAVFLRDKKEGETLPFMDTSKLKRAMEDHFTPFKESLREYLGLLQEAHAPASSNQPYRQETGRT